MKTFIFLCSVLICFIIHTFYTSCKEKEHFITLFTPFYIPKSDRKNILSFTTAHSLYNKNIIKTTVTLYFPIFFSNHLKTRILLDISNHTPIETITELTTQEEANLTVMDEIELSIMHQTPEVKFVSKLANRYLFAITRYCDRIIDFRDIKCRKIGIHPNFRHVWTAFLQLFKLDGLRLVDINQNPNDVESPMNVLNYIRNGKIDVYLHCDYFPNQLITRALLDDGNSTLELVKFPFLTKEDIIHNNMNQNINLFKLQRLSINELMHKEKTDRPSDIRHYNAYQMFGEDFSYRTYSISEILITQTKLPKEITYWISKVIYERLAMRNNDSLISTNGLKIQYAEGTLDFIEEVTQSAKLSTLVYKQPQQMYDASLEQEDTESSIIKQYQEKPNSLQVLNS